MGIFVIDFLVDNYLNLLSKNLYRETYIRYSKMKKYLKQKFISDEAMSLSWPHSLSFMGHHADRRQ